eukprot:Lankesteria_metandrocarpae@DN8371_c0_g1_i1.p1
MSSALLRFFSVTAAKKHKETKAATTVQTRGAGGHIQPQNGGEWNAGVKVDDTRHHNQTNNPFNVSPTKAYMSPHYDDLRSIPATTKTAFETSKSWNVPAAIVSGTDTVYKPPPPEFPSSLRPREPYLSIDLLDAPLSDSKSSTETKVVNDVLPNAPELASKPNKDDHRARTDTKTSVVQLRVANPDAVPKRSSKKEKHKLSNLAPAPDRSRSSKRHHRSTATSTHVTFRSNSDFTLPTTNINVNHPVSTESNRSTTNIKPMKSTQGTRSKSRIVSTTTNISTAAATTST